MKLKGILQRVFLVMCICLAFMGMAVYAAETDSGEEPSQVSILGTIRGEVDNWNRRIYKLTCEVDGEDSRNGDIRVYAGKNFHVTDSKGNILSEGTYMDANGNVSEDFKGGKICRDINGWYILWENTGLKEWGLHRLYVQADSDFVGGNNQTIGIEGMSGVYLDSESAVADVPFDTMKVNVAAEVDASDVVFPVMQGMDLSQSDFLNKASVKMECVYGNLRDLPLRVQWYRVVNGVEEAVGDMITRAPYHLPESEAKTLTEAKEYKVKIYYNGEASTEEAKSASGESYDSGLKFNMPEENIELYAQWKKLPEPETLPEDGENPEPPDKGGVWPLVILAVIGAACIIAYVVYQWFSHRKR